ncbi:tRNA (adenosine(37)-N6)-threonylcarbamoyltransferase complex dimerization subunit type 1 TsaB [Verrucomicrobiaceae bacterium 227]
MPTEWILAIETSVTNATLALARDGLVTARQSFSSERSQECDLFAPLQEILTQLPQGTNLSAIVVGTGPGSYNGARVGIAAAQALAQVHGCGVAGVCSFEGVPAVHDCESAWAVGDARRGSFFVMPIVQGRVTAPPDLLGENDFQDRLNQCQGPKVTFESPDRLPKGHKITEVISDAEILVRSWLTRTSAEKEALQTIPAEAFYLRPPHITKSKKKVL